MRFSQISRNKVHMMNLLPLQIGAMVAWSLFTLCNSSESLRGCVVHINCIDKNVTCYKCCEGYIEDNNDTCVFEVVLKTTLSTSKNQTVGLQTTSIDETVTKGLTSTTSAHKNLVGSSIKREEKMTFTPAQNIVNNVEDVNTTEVSNSAENITTNVPNWLTYGVNTTYTTLSSPTYVSIFSASSKYKKFILIVVPISVVFGTFAVVLLLLVAFYLFNRKTINSRSKSVNTCYRKHANKFTREKSIDPESSVGTTETSRNSTNYNDNVFEPA